MQDRAVVDAVVAGDEGGFAAAYDQYAASLYAYCHSMLPAPEAAEAVLDTFLVAAAKLAELRDPDRLGPWLQAVARNECLRRLGPEGLEGPAAADPAAPGSDDTDDDVLPAVTLPPGLRGKVLAACTDSTPAGRAHRISVAHRAGTFGPAGFPRAIGPSGPRWWRHARRHPGLVSAAAMLAALVLTAGVTVALTAGGGSHRPQAAGPGLDAGGLAPAVPGSTVPGSTSPAPSPSHKPTAHATPPASAPAGATSPAASPGRQTPPAPPPPSPSLSSPPAQGFLLLAPDQLMLTSKSGKPVSGFFVLTAVNGPVPQYSIQVTTGAGRISVTPVAGSLPADGFVQVRVTVTSKAALTAQIVVEPGNLTVTVVYKPKPAPAPAPSPSPTGGGGGNGNGGGNGGGGDG